MPLNLKVEGILDNYLGHKDELAVVQPFVAPPMPRFNPATAQVPGKPLPPATFDRVGKMASSRTCGASPPSSRARLRGTLNPQLRRLNSIFQQYAKSGTAGATSMSALLRSSRPSSPPCARLRLADGEFNTTRINNIFTRADQVDDTLKATKVKTRRRRKREKKGTAVDKNDQLRRPPVAEVEVEVMMATTPSRATRGSPSPKSRPCAPSRFPRQPEARRGRPQRRVRVPAARLPRQAARRPGAHQRQARQAQGASSRRWRPTRRCICAHARREEAAAEDDARLEVVRRRDQGGRAQGLRQAGDEHGHAAGRADQAARHQGDHDHADAQGQGRRLARPPLSSRGSTPRAPSRRARICARGATRPRRRGQRDDRL